MVGKRVNKPMNLSIIGASDMFARGLATWAVAAGHNVTIVGFNREQAEELVKKIGSARAVGPGDPLPDNVIFLAMPFNCVLDAGNFYGKRLSGKIVVDVTTPIDLNTFEQIHPEAGSVAEEIVKAGFGARVVKAFYPKFAGTLVWQQKSNQETSDAFVAGDDVEAKSVVMQLFEQSGLRPIDVGHMSRARELEDMGHLQAARRRALEGGFAAAR